MYCSDKNKNIFCKKVKIVVPYCACLTLALNPPCWWGVRGDRRVGEGGTGSMHWPHPLQSALSCAVWVLVAQRIGQTRT